MPNFEVGVHLTNYGTVEVEADSENEAMLIVKEKFNAEDIANSTESADAEYTIVSGQEGYGVHNLVIGDRVKVVDQDITGEIVRWDRAKAVVLDDDREMWIEEEDEEGVLVFPISELEREGQGA
tara:strand:+ start:11327 stop:11698 length:372 start_codon:yes stop_codon:yes gene_type:complete